MNPSANLFVFGDFNVHHKDWFTYSGGTDKSGKLINFLSQTTLLRWLTFVLRSQTVILTVLLFWIYFSSDASICSTMTFPPFGNSDHVAVSVSIDFPSYSE